MRYSKFKYYFNVQFMQMLQLGQIYKYNRYNSNTTMRKKLLKRQHSHFQRQNNDKRHSKYIERKRLSSQLLISRINTQNEQYRLTDCFPRYSQQSNKAATERVCYITSKRSLNDLSINAYDTCKEITNQNIIWINGKNTIVDRVASPSNMNHENSSNKISPGQYRNSELIRRKSFHNDQYINLYHRNKLLSENIECLQNQNIKYCQQIQTKNIYNEQLQQQLKGMETVALQQEQKIQAISTQLEQHKNKQDILHHILKKLKHEIFELRTQNTDLKNDKLKSSNKLKAIKTYMMSENKQNISYQITTSQPIKSKPHSRNNSMKHLSTPLNNYTGMINYHCVGNDSFELSPDCHQTDYQL